MKNILPTLFIIGIIVFVGISLTEKGTQTGSQNSQSKNDASATLTPADDNLTAVNEEVNTITCSGKPTVALTEGPYYKEGSPERINIRNSEDDENEGSETNGATFNLSGYVLNTDCEPIQNAWLDFWQTDSEGNYDNEGYGFRGHQYTDTNGFYVLETVVPAEYPGRTPHIHVKVRSSENSPIITTQLFLPGVEGNITDSIFDDSLIIEMSDTPDGKKGQYNFIIETD